LPAKGRTGDVSSGGDAKALETLYHERYEDFLRIARSITRDDASARDAVQEAFARAIRSLNTFRGESALDGWVWGIVLNTARSTRPAAPLTLLVEEPATADVEADDGATFRRWVSELPERQRLVVFLRYWADLDYRSIAEALGIEVGTVSATLNAAHAALRRSLREVS
jgi:RNA polymerase sigma-70 factor (ECF subfamily)